MTEKELYVRADRDATRDWPKMSAEEQAEHDAIFRMLLADRIKPPPPVVILLVDEDLPANTVASVVADPTNSARPMLVFSRRTYSFAARVMANYVPTSKKANALFRQFGRLDVTADAKVVGPDRRTLVEFKLPPQVMWDMTDLTELTAGATSSESVELPDVGRGQLYRFPLAIR